MLRRSFMTAILLGCLHESRAWRGGQPSDLDRWARAVADLNDRLVRGELGVVDWQHAIAKLNTSVEVAALVRYLDIAKLTAHFTYASNLAETVDPVLPGAHPHRWFVRVFALRKGGAVIPHVHNSMVSAHLVIAGELHARTHDRLHDLADAVVLRPSIDRALVPGEIITMSDQHDNAHWLVATSDHAMTLDVGVVDMPPSWRYGLPANKYNMIFVDADRPPERDGTIIAPTMTFEQCVAKYAA